MGPSADARRLANRRLLIQAPLQKDLGVQGTDPFLQKGVNLSVAESVGFGGPPASPGRSGHWCRSIDASWR